MRGIVIRLGETTFVAQSEGGNYTFVDADTDILDLDDVVEWDACGGYVRNISKNQSINAYLDDED